MTARSSHEQLVAAWWDYQRLASGDRRDRLGLERGERGWAQQAYDAVAASVAEGAPNVVELLRDLAEAAPEGHGPGTVGAGPLEDLLHLHGDELVEVVDACARTSAAFAAELSTVWLEPGHVDPRTVAQLSRWVPEHG